MREAQGGPRVASAIEEEVARVVKVGDGEGTATKPREREREKKREEFEREKES